MTLLIRKPARTGEVVTIKLASGEEIIARLDSENDKIVKLHRPMTLSYTAQGVGMTPWMITAEEDNIVEIEKDKWIMAMNPTGKRTADQYIEGTTGIKPVRMP
jgi:hypothetical protein